MKVVDWLSRISPLAKDLTTYNLKLLKGDFTAAITVSIILVPQAIAYAFLAGMPPVYGLYAGLVPLIIYAILGSSRYLSIGPVAISSVLLLSGVSSIAEPMSASYISLVLFTGLLVGIVQALFGVFRLGFVVNFLSRPVLAGFISAAAVIIIVSQLKDAFGISLSSRGSFLLQLREIITGIDGANRIAIANTLVSLVILYLFRRWKLMFLGTFLAVVGSGIISAILNFDNHGVAIIGTVPGGLPSLEFPKLGWSEFRLLIPTVMTVSFMGIIECMSISKALEVKHASNTLQPNREFIAIGLSKIFGSFFQALPSSGSFSRSAINDSSGAKTQFSSVLIVLILIMVLMFLTPFFYYIPKATLATIIIFSVFKLIDIEEAKYLFSVHKIDLFLMIATFLCTLLMGVELGVIIGVALSFIMMLYQSSIPVVVELGRIQGTQHFRNIERFKKAVREEKYLIIRLDNQLFFGNASSFKEKLFDILEERETAPSIVMLDASNIFEMDSTGLQALEEINDMLIQRNIKFVIAGAIGNIRDLFKLSGFLERHGKKNHFMTVRNAIEHFDKSGDAWSEYAIQTDY